MKSKRCSVQIKDNPFNFSFIVLLVCHVLGEYGKSINNIETNIFWTRFSYAAGEIPTHPPSWTQLRKSTSGKTKEEVDRQRQGGLQPTGVDAH